METRDRTVGGVGGSLPARTLATAVDRALVGERGQARNPRVGEWYRSLGNTWDIKSDGSCGWEIVTPAIKLDDSGHHSVLEKVCREIGSENPLVDRKCGLHVHVELPDYDWQALQALLRFWIRYEPFFLELTPVYRRSNHFCAPYRGSRWSDRIPTEIRSALTTNSRTQFDRIARGVNFPKYKSLRIDTFWAHQRVEFRLHSGTVLYDKIRAWGMLVTAVVQRVLEPNMPPITAMDTPSRSLSTSYMMRQLGLIPSSIRDDIPQESLELAAWVNARRQQFAPNAPPLTPPQPARPTTYPGTRLQFRTLSTVGECDAAIPVACREPCAPGFRFCVTHLEDYREARDYRIIQTAGAMP